MEFSRISVKIVMRVMLFCDLFLLWMLVGHHVGWFLTVILEMRRMLVVIVVSIIDERVGLPEMVRRFLADPISVMREGANAAILDMVLVLKHEFHDVSVLHCTK
jgi:hypothetical protein